MTEAGNWQAVPTDLRRPLLSGLRWTLWLALAGVPFAYATRVLLARVSPDCLAVFGLLVVYINYVAAFLFLGGNAVAIRYVPTLDANQRPDFLATYGLILLAAWVPWLVAALLAPDAFRWLFGSLARPVFAAVMVALAPLVIAFSLLLAGLKGALDLAAAQALYRMVTVATFLGVLVAYVFARDLLAAHAAWLLWGWYLALMAAGTVAAAHRWRRRTAAAAPFRRWLPRGFWPYTLGLQGSSMLGFFVAQLDVLLVLHAGGLHRLGAYVAVMSFAALMTAALKLLLDAHMTALTHGAARHDAGLTGTLFQSSSRLLLPLSLLPAVALACFAAPLLAIYGPDYIRFAPALRWLGPAAAVAGLNFLLGSSLAALGHPRAEILAKCVRIAAYVLLFFPLWHTYGIAGAVIAWGAAEIPYQVLHLHLLRRLAPFRLHWRRLYSAFAVTVILAAVLTQWRQPESWAAGLWVWALLVVVFFVLGGYSRAELGGQLRVFLPGLAAGGNL